MYICKKLISGISHLNSNYILLYWLSNQQSMKYRGILQNSFLYLFLPLYTVHYTLKEMAFILWLSHFYFCGWGNCILLQTILTAAVKTDLIFAFLSALSPPSAHSAEHLL